MDIGKRSSQEVSADVTRGGNSQTTSIYQGEGAGGGSRRRVGRGLKAGGILWGGLGGGGRGGKGGGRGMLCGGGGLWRRLGCGQSKWVSVYSISFHSIGRLCLSLDCVCRSPVSVGRLCRSVACEKRSLGRFRLAASAPYSAPTFPLLTDVPSSPQTFPPSTDVPSIPSPSSLTCLVE